MQNKSYINLDTNATSGVDAALWPYLEGVLKDCLNPSSVHQAGQKAKFLIEEAREDIKNFINSKDARIVFTSGASESNNLILNSLFRNGRPLEESHLITSAVEHISMLEPARKLGEEGLNLTIISPQKKSSFKTEDFLAAIKSETKMISLMFANNETGDILPVKSLAEKVKKTHPDIFMFSDSVQAIAKFDFDFADSKLDGVSLSGHKIGALPGAGVLVVKDDTVLVPSILGGPQELRFRAGTENLPGIVSFGYMARKLKNESVVRVEKLLKIKNAIRTELFNRISGLSLNSFSKESLPNTLNILVPGVLSDDLVVALDLEGILISSASACASGKPLPSHVLLAWGLAEVEARQSIRLSFSESLKEEELKIAINAIVSSVERMRGTATSGSLERHA